MNRVTFKLLAGVCVLGLAGFIAASATPARRALHSPPTVSQRGANPVATPPPRHERIPAALQPALYRSLARDAGAAYTVNAKGCATLSKQRLEACFNQYGAQFSGAGSQLALHLEAWGRGGDLSPIAAVRPKISGHRVSYAHGNLTEWWRVLPIGFEQGFTIAKRPRGHGKLELALAASGKPRRRNGALSWGRFRYGELVVTDAEGEIVPSKLENESGRILISVNDVQAVYPLTIDPLVWIEQKVVASDGGALDAFGWSFAVHGDTAFIGAYYDTIGSSQFQGAVYVFTETRGTWTQTQKLIANDGAGGDDFGTSVALSSDGTTAFIGAPDATVDGNHLQGKVYVFDESGGVWSQSQILTPSDGATLDLFGISVAVEADNALIGAFGATIKGNAYQGAVYAFSKANGIWSQTQKLLASDGVANDQFGQQLAMQNNTAVIGADEATYADEYPGNGAAYVFTLSQGTWTQTQRLGADDGEPGDYFGRWLALDGSTIVVGSPAATINGNTFQGAVYMFTESDGTWSQTAKLLAADGELGDFFGDAVDISGNTVLIGAPGATVNDNPYTGAAYIFTDSGGSWTQINKLISSDGTLGDEFGYAVALRGNDTAFIGAPHPTNDGTNSPGAAYIYGESDLGLVVSAPQTVGQGQLYTSQTIATNIASVASPAVSATITIPAAASFVSATATQGSCSEVSNVVSCNFGSINGNAGTAMANIIVKVTSDTGGTIVNTASVAKATPSLTASAATVIVDSPPVAEDGTLTTYENVATSGTLVASDPGDDPLTFVIDTQPDYGNVTLDNASTGAYTYTPDQGYSGPDSFTFKASDGQVDSNVATISIAVQAAVPPVAGDLTLTTYENETIAGTLPASGPGGDALSFAIGTQPVHGTIAITDTAIGAFTYTPDTDYSGPDSFTFTATDTVTGLVSNTATVTLTIKAPPPPNAVAPVASDLDLTVYENTAIAGVLPAVVTPAADTLVFALAAQPTHGTVSITNASTGAFTYTPDTDYSGADSFTFTAKDTVTGLVSNTATVTLTIKATPPPNAVAPVASDLDFTIYENTAITGVLPAVVTPAADTLVFALAAQPMHGTVVIADTTTGAFTYTPDMDYSGADSFTFTAKDAVTGLVSNTATVTLLINATPPPTPVAPVANDMALAAYENVALTGRLPAAVTPTSDALSFAIAAQPAHGMVAITDAATGTFTYTPTHGYSGADTFTFTAQDMVTGLTSNVATVHVTINATPPPNEVPPVASNLALATYENETVTGTLPAVVTPSADTLIFAFAVKPTHGTASITNAKTGAFTYTPASDYSGSDSFTFMAKDTVTGLRSNAATVTLIVNPTPPPNAVPPVASDLTLTTYTDTAISGTLPAAVTPAGDPLAFKLVAKPAHGTLKLDAASGTFNYKPAADYVGRDNFIFTVIDTTTGLASNVATVTIHVYTYTPPKPPSSGGGSWGAAGLLFLAALAGLVALVRRRR